MVCIHNRRKDRCKDCKGSGICIHDRRKSRCKDCGTGYCEHNRQKSRCKDCGTGYCEHNRRKSLCKDCGTGYCEHNRRKSLCIYCSPQIGCLNCKEMIQSSYKKYKPYCFRCFCILNPDLEIKRRYKTKELHLHDEIKDYGFINDKTISGGCSRNRPDFLLDLFTHTVIVECDENAHRNYKTTCEISKINNQFTDLADRPMILIRFNPDVYKGKSCFNKDHQLIETEWKRRIKTLKNIIEKYIKQIPNELFTEIKLFF